MAISQVIGLDAGVGMQRRHPRPISVEHLRSIAPIRTVFVALTAISAGGCGTHLDSKPRQGSLSLPATQETSVTALEWGQQQRIAAPTPDEKPSFGTTVAAAGDFLFVGSKTETDVFTFSGLEWQIKFSLQPSLTAATSLSVRGTVAAVGVPGEQSSSSQATGVVYVTRKTGQDWPDTAARLEGEREGDAFGASVAIGTDLLVVGAPGSDDAGVDSGLVYLFAKSGSGWAQPMKLIPPSSPNNVDGHFGSSVAVSSTDDTVVVGAPYDSEYHRLAGAAYVFRREGREWVRTALARTDAADYDRFGASVAVDGSTVLVGSPGRTEDAPDAGAVYVFSQDTGFSEPEKLLPEQSAENDQFGYSVALAGNVALIGAPYRMPNGAAYLFTRAGNQWTARPPFNPPDELAVEYMGLSVALSRTSVLIGSPNGWLEPGAAYSVAIQNGARCDTNTDCVSWNCVDGVCCDDRCEGSCRSCLASQKGSGVDGACGPIAELAAPREDGCAVDPGDLCGATGTCDGHGECSFRAIGTICGAPTCADGALVTLACDGQGYCAEHASDCAPYRCSAKGCLTACTTDRHCSSEAFCSEDGMCKAKHSLSTLCTSGRECASGHCADGVCCDAACDGPCEGCAESKFRGSCVPIRGEPRHDHPSCQQGSPEQPCLTAKCDGESTSSCLEYANSEVACEVFGCDGTDNADEGSCDGSGSCKCPTGPRCNEDRTAVIGEGGQPTTCAPYRCHVNICLERCATDGDCAQDLDCNPTSQKCEVLQARPNEGGCSVNSSQGERRRFFLVYILMAAVVTGQRAYKRTRQFSRATIPNS